MHDDSQLDLILNEFFLGLVESILNLMDLSLEVPHYSTVSHCSKQLTIALEPLKTQGAIHLAVDSTGLKIYGEGEWKVRQHGVGKRRTWRKLHLAVNPKNNQIKSAIMTTNDFKDNELLPDLVDAIDKPIASLRKTVVMIVMLARSISIIER